MFKKVIIAIAAALLLVSCGSSRKSAINEDFNFVFETPETASTRHHLNKDCVISIFIAKGPTQPYTVVTNLYKLDPSSGEFRRLDTIYDLPEGTDMYLGRHYECFFKDAPKGFYRVEVTLTKGNKTVTRTAEFSLPK